MTATFPSVGDGSIRPSLVEEHVRIAIFREQVGSKLVQLRARQHRARDSIRAAPPITSAAAIVAKDSAGMNTFITAAATAAVALDGR